MIFNFVNDLRERGEKFEYVNMDYDYEHDVGLNPQSTDLFTFYQICVNPNKDNLFGVRKFTYDGKHNIISIDNKYCKRTHIDKFIDRCSPNKYKKYSVTKIEALPNPHFNDFCTSSSQMLNIINDDVKYAAF